MLPPLYFASKKLYGGVAQKRDSGCLKKLYRGGVYFRDSWLNKMLGGGREPYSIILRYPLNFGVWISGVGLGGLGLSALLCPLLRPKTSPFGLSSVSPCHLAPPPPFAWVSLGKRGRTSAHSLPRFCWHRSGRCPALRWLGLSASHRTPHTARLPCRWPCTRQGSVGWSRSIQPSNHGYKRTAPKRVRA